MKASTAILVAVASGLVIAAAWFFRPRKRPLRITAQELGYRERTPEELAWSIFLI